MAPGPVWEGDCRLAPGAAGTCPADGADGAHAPGPGQRERRKAERSFARPGDL